MSAKYVPPFRRAVPGRIARVDDSPVQIRDTPKVKADEEEEKKKTVHNTGAKDWPQVKEALLDQDDERIVNDRIAFAALSRLLNAQAHVIMRDPMFGKNTLAKAAKGPYAKDAVWLFLLNKRIQTAREKAQIAVLQAAKPDDKINMLKAAPEPRGHLVGHLLRWMYFCAFPVKAKEICHSLAKADREEQKKWARLLERNDEEEEKEAGAMLGELENRTKLSQQVDAKWQVPLSEAINAAVQSSHFLSELPNCLSVTVPRKMQPSERFDARHIPVLDLLLQGMASAEVYGKLPVDVSAWLSNQVQPELREFKQKGPPLGDAASAFVLVVNRDPTFRGLLSQRQSTQRRAGDDGGESKAKQLHIHPRHYAAFFETPRGIRRHIGYCSMRQPFYVPQWYRAKRLLPANQKKNKDNYFPLLHSVPPPPFDKPERTIAALKPSTARSYRMYCLLRWLQVVDEQLRGDAATPLNAEFASLPKLVRAAIRDMLTGMMGVVGEHLRTTNKPLGDTGLDYAVHIALVHVPLPDVTTDPLFVLPVDRLPLDKMIKDAKRINAYYTDRFPLGGLSRACYAQLFESESFFASFVDFCYSTLMKGVVYEALLKANPAAFPDDDREHYNTVLKGDRRHKEGPYWIGARFMDKMLNALDNVEDCIAKVENKIREPFDFDETAERKSCGMRWFRHFLFPEMARFAAHARHVLGRRILMDRECVELLRRGVKATWEYIETKGDQDSAMNLVSSLPPEVKQDTTAIHQLGRVLWTDRFDKMPPLKELDRVQKQKLTRLLVSTTPMRRLLVLLGKEEEEEARAFQLVLYDVKTAMLKFPALDDVGNWSTRK
jgi:hypothetical protein